MSAQLWQLRVWWHRKLPARDKEEVPDSWAPTMPRAHTSSAPNWGQRPGTGTAGSAIRPLRRAPPRTGGLTSARADKDGRVFAQKSHLLRGQPWPPNPTLPPHPTRGSSSSVYLSPCTCHPRAKPTGPLCGFLFPQRCELREGRRWVPSQRCPQPLAQHPALGGTPCLWSELMMERAPDPAPHPIQASSRG